MSKASDKSEDSVRQRGPDVKFWDDRIRKDLAHRMSMYDPIWRDNREVVKNVGRRNFFSNLAREFSQKVRDKLIAMNFFMKVSTDDADFKKRTEELTVMSNSLARSIRLKQTLDDCVETGLWACTGWIEVGHTLDYHSLDPDRSIMYRANPNSFDPSDMTDVYEEVPDTDIEAAGIDKDEVKPFDPFQQPVIEEPTKKEPIITFDPNFGAPWMREISPFMIVIPKTTKKIEDADYITKLVILSVAELRLLTQDEIPDSYYSKMYQSICDEIPGHEFIEKKVMLAITFIRRDRNDPANNGWYLAHVLGYPDIVIKSSVNPFGGMIPLIPIKVRKEMNMWERSYIEDLLPHAEQYSKIVDGAYKRIRRSLNAKWAMDQNTSLDKNSRANFRNPDYTGEIKLETGSAQGIQHLQEAGLDQSIIAAINLASKLAQGASNQTDIDRGTPVKKISARQTEALLASSDIFINAMRIPVADAAGEVILKVIHLLNLFSPPREFIYTFGSNVVKINPGGNDFTTSYSYRFEAKDMEGPLDADEQIVLVQFISRIVPLLGQFYNMNELANECRRAFGFGPEVMNQMPGQAPPGAPQIGPDGRPIVQGGGGLSNPLDAGVAPGLDLGGGGTHPERLPGDQGISQQNVSNLMAGARRGA